MSALDTLLGFTRMIGGGQATARTARVLRWGTGFGVAFDSNEEATVTFTPPEVVPHWRSVVDVDFSTAAVTAIGADGEYQLGGQWFTFANFGSLHNPAVQWQIIAGSGLYLSANAAGTLFSSGTLPELRVQLSDYVLGAPLRCRARYVSSFGSDIETILALRWTGDDPAYCGVGGGSHAAGLGFESLLVRRTDDGNALSFSPISFDPASESGIQNVLGFTMPLGAGVVRPLLVELSDSIFGGWQSEANALVRSVYFDAAAARIDHNFYGINNARPTIALGAQFTSPSNSTGVRIQGLRVDQFY